MQQATPLTNMHLVKSAGKSAEGGALMRRMWKQASSTPYSLQESS